MVEKLKRSLVLVEASLLEMSSMVRHGGEQLSEDIMVELLSIEEIQSNVLARLLNTLKQLEGNDDYLTELPAEVAKLQFDPYPGEDDEETDDLLNTTISSDM